MADITYKQAINEGRMKLIGPPLLINNVSSWLPGALRAEIRSAHEITGAAPYRNNDFIAQRNCEGQQEDD